MELLAGGFRRAEGGIVSAEFAIANAPANVSIPRSFFAISMDVSAEIFNSSSILRQERRSGIQGSSAFLPAAGRRVCSR